MSWLPPGKPKPTPLKLRTWVTTDHSAPLDYHMHTKWTDGTATVEQMAVAARSKGLSTILYSEHIRHTSTYFPEFVAEVREVRNPGMTVHVGFETKVLDLQGSLDCPAEAAALSDALIGSVHNPPAIEGEPGGWSHRSPQAALDLEFALAMAIVTGSQAHILGHPMGIVVTKFGLKPKEQLSALAEACRAADKAFELNARYCNDPLAWIEVVTRAGCKISFGSDAHDTDSVGSSWELFLKLRQQA